MKKTLILFGLFVILALIVYFYEYKGGQEREQRDELKGSLFKIDKEKIESVTMIRSLDDSISYVRSETGDWKIVIPVKTEAEGSTVSESIGAITSAKIKRRFVTSSDKLKNFGLNPPVAEVILGSSENGSIHLYVGDEAATRGDLFVWFPGDLTSLKKDSVEVLVTSKNVYDQTQKSLFDFRDKKIAHFNENEVRKVELTSSEGRVLLERSGNEWEMLIPHSVPVDGSTITSFLRSLKNYSVKEFVQESLDERERFGFHEPGVNLTLSLGEELSLKELVIGDKKEDDDSFYGYESGRSPVFLISESIVNSLSKSPFYFQDKKLIKVEKDDITEILFSGTHHLLISKEDTLGWYAQVDSTVKVTDSKMDRLFSLLSGLSARELVTYDPDNLDSYGLSEGSGQGKFLETVLMKDGLEVSRFAVGDTVENDRYIRNLEYPFIYFISRSQIENLTDWLDESVIPE